jgi:hypothetical protein
LAGNPGTYTYTVSSSDAHLSYPTAILKLKFRPLTNAPMGSQAKVITTSFDYPGRKEVQAQLTDGIIIIDSSCGNTHLLSGTAWGTFVDQNHPNPFSIAMGSSRIPFDVGADDTYVSLRVLDLTGKEIARLIDNKVFNHGRYEVTIDPAQYPSGTYMYEFQATGMKPQIKKMVIGN